jgi:putative transposase
MFKTSDENLPEVREMFKEIMKQPEKMFEMLRIDLKSTCEAAIAKLIKAELTDYLGRERYSRAKNNKRKKNYRNGSYLRKYTVKNLGTLDLKIARDRNGTFQSKMIDKYDRYEKVLEKDICLMFLSGLSTRGISMISKTLIGRKISHSEVSNVNKELLRGIEAWRTRSLHDIPIKYMYIDGVNFDMRVDRKVEKLPMLIVVGVTTENQKIFLAIQQGDKESASTWREVFKDLKLRGLAAHKVQLGIMDGLPGLEKVFGEEFMNAKIQRCQVHVARNVLCKVPKSLKKDVADRLRDVFYASSREKAKINFHLFIEKYEETIPSAVKSLKNNIDNCLTFYSFPEEEWISLRTSNTIERVNKEFKRRTKPMEILAGEESAYRLLSFVALKMELNWRSAPVGRNNLPSLDKFTHKS